MKSQFAGSLFGALMIGSSFALLNMTGLNVTGLEIPYLKGQPAYAVTSQTLEVSDTELPAPQTLQVARRFRSVSR
jgi:hypothetical protein